VFVSAPYTIDRQLYCSPSVIVGPNCSTHLVRKFLGLGLETFRRAMRYLHDTMTRELESAQDWSQ
jgi:hypothetical protein